MLKGITFQQPGVEMSNNQHFVGGGSGGGGGGGSGGGGCHCIPVSGIFDHKLTVS